MLEASSKKLGLVRSKVEFGLEGHLMLNKCNLIGVCRNTITNMYVKGCELKHSCKSKG